MNDQPEDHIPNELAVRALEHHGGKEDHFAGRRRSNGNVEGVLHLHNLWGTELI